MADLWMDVDTALSEVPVNLMPLIDDSDFKSIEADVNYNATGLVLIWHFVTTAGAYSQTAVTPTDTGGDYDWVEQGNGLFTIEIPASAGGTINNDTEGFGWFTGVATGILPWRGPVIGFRKAELNAVMSSGDLTTTMKASVNNEVDTALSDIRLDHLVAVADSDDVVDNSIIAKIATKAGTANWSDFVNTTDSLEAIRDAQVSAAPINHSATANTESGNTTLDAGTYADTATNDGVNYYKTGPGVAVGGFGLDCYLTFNIGIGRVPTSVIVDGHFDAGASRTVQVWAYDYILADYVQLSNSVTDFGNSGSDNDYQYAMTINMVQVSDGEVLIRFTSTSVTGADVWWCDYVALTSVIQEAAGLTADSIQAAVWARADSGHDEATLGYNLAQYFIRKGHPVSATSGSQFIIDTGLAVNDAYNGMLIMVEDKTDGHYEIKRIIDYIGATKEVFTDATLAFTPATEDDYYILSAGYGNVNVTHISGTSQTANDNGADINEILTDTETTLDTLVNDIPNTAEFEARTLPNADYVVVGDTIAGVTTVGSVTTKTGYELADGAITAAKIATDAIDADSLKADAVTEIVDAIMAKVIDGTITWAVAAKIILAHAAGDMNLAAGTYTMKDQSGATLYTFTVDATDRDVTIP